MRIRNGSQASRLHVVTDINRLLCGLALVLPLLCSGAPLAFADNGSAPVGDPVLEPSTLRCLGVYWVIRGDDNQNAAVTFDYRKAGTTDWRHGAPLFRVERREKPYLDEGGKPKPPSKVIVPADAWLFAGSLLLLDPDTAYDLKLKLIDPDGGDVEKSLSARTIAEPVAANDAPIRHVRPGAGGGSGTEADPFRASRRPEAPPGPGDILLLHAGTYDGPLRTSKIAASRASRSSGAARGRRGGPRRQKPGRQTCRFGG